MDRPMAQTPCDGLITVIDNFVEEQTCWRLLKSFPELNESDRTALDMISVPAELERNIWKVLNECSSGMEFNLMPSSDWNAEEVMLPARVARGNSPMHRDTAFDKFEKPDPGYVKGYVAVLYLDGSGTLVVDSGTEQHYIGVKPGRLVVWPNDTCLHRLDDSPQGGVRKMIGPMSLKGGAWQRAGDQFAAWAGYPCQECGTLGSEVGICRGCYDKKHERQRHEILAKESRSDGDRTTVAHLQSRQTEPPAKPPEDAKGKRSSKQKTPAAPSRARTIPTYITGSGKPPPGPPLASSPLPGCEDLKFAVRAGRVGMKNLGNTCFMNTGLQCLSHIEPLASFFLTGKYKEDVNDKNPRGCKGQMASAFAKLQQVLWQNENTPLDPTGLRNLFTSFSPKLFQNGDQQDVQEFLAFCVDALHEDLNRANPSASPDVIKKDLESVGGEINDEMAAALAWGRHLQHDKSFIVDLMQGQLCSTLTCTTCGHTAKLFDPFLYLSVPVTQAMQNVTHALDKFHEEELLAKGEQWYCGSCCAKRDAIKRIILWKLPPVLVLHLKRFACNPQTLKFRKLTNPLSVPLELDLEPHCSSKQRHGATYQLCCAAAHQGRYGSGHYAAVCRIDGFKDGYNWFFYDDHNIHALTLEQAGQMVAKHGYVLFFMRCEENLTAGPTRQTITSPELWPHVVSKRNSLISDVLAGHAKQSSPRTTHAEKRRPSKERRLENQLSQLVVGDRVLCLGVKPHAPGTIRFIGTTSFSQGEWIGIELDENLGKNDGTVKGVSYFPCKPHGGLFVRRSPVAVRPLSNVSSGSPLFGSPSSPSWTDGATAASPPLGQTMSFGAKLAKELEDPSPQNSKVPASDSRADKATWGVEGPDDIKHKNSKVNSSNGKAGKPAARQKAIARNSWSKEEAHKEMESTIHVSPKDEMRGAVRACASEVEKLKNVVERLSTVLEAAGGAKPVSDRQSPRRAVWQRSGHGMDTYQGSPHHSSKSGYPGEPHWGDAETSINRSPPPWASRSLQPHHKAHLEHLLSDAGARLSKRLEAHIRGPLDKQVNEAVSRPLKELRSVAERVKHLQKK